MSASQPSSSNSEVSREAEEEGRVQDVLAQARAYLRKAPKDWDGDAPDDWNRAISEMAKAETAATAVRHWGDIAKCWARDFGLTEAAERCLGKTSGLAGQDARVAIVDYRTQERDEAGRVVRHIIGYRMAPTPVYLETLRSIIFQAARDAEALKESMQKTYALVENHQSSLRMHSKFDEETLRYFEKSESMQCWLYIAQIWARELGEREPGLHCAAKAEEIAADLSNIPHWAEVAKFWMRVMGQPEQARRCVAEAEKTLIDHTPQSYISLAEGVAAIGDPELPVQYLDKAESLIEELADWSIIKYTWEELGYLDLAERADNIWEYLAAKVTDAEYIANGGGYGRYAPGDGPY